MDHRGGGQGWIHQNEFNKDHLIWPAGPTDGMGCVQVQWSRPECGPRCFYTRFDVSVLRLFCKHKVIEEFGCLLYGHFSWLHFLILIVDIIFVFRCLDLVVNVIKWPEVGLESMNTSIYTIYDPWTFHEVFECIQTTEGATVQTLAES